MGAFSGWRLGASAAGWLLAATLSAACGRGGLVVLEGEGGAGATGGVGSTVDATAGVVVSSSAATTGAGGAPPEICYSDDNCTDCIAMRCPEAWCDCTDSPDCFGLFNCFDFCNEDKACEQTCLAQHQDGISLALLVTGCAGTTCDDKCPFWGNEDFSPCAECALNACPGVLNICLADPQCNGLWSCFIDCPPLDLTCQQQCYLDWPESVQLLEDVLMCVNPACDDVCD